MKKILTAAVILAALSFISAGEIKVSKSLNRDYWLNIKGGKVKDLTSNEKFKSMPDGSDEITAGFKAVSWKDKNKDQRWGVYFGEKIYGYLIPQTSGEYIFSLSNDDEAELFISSDELPGNKKKVISQGFSYYGKWRKGSKPVKLEAGKVYYIELLHKERHGNTYALVGWKIPRSNKFELITAEYLSSFKNGIPNKIMIKDELLPIHALHKKDKKHAHAPKSVEDSFKSFLKRSGWQLDGKSYFIQSTDIHINDRGPLKMLNKYKGKNFITDMNMLKPRPVFMVVTGDMVSDVFRHKSSWKRAESGFLTCRKLFAQLDKKIPYYLILGNNGCSWEMFKKAWPDRPLYWSFDKNDIHYVGLMGYNNWKPENSNHAGITLDKKQWQWLKADLKGRENQTLVIFSHEPLYLQDSHLVFDPLKKLLANWKGEVWNVAGHTHINALQRIKLPQSTMYFVETTTPVGVWRPKKGAYRLFYLVDGKIEATALRWITFDGKPVKYELCAPKNTWPYYVSPYEKLKDKLIWYEKLGKGNVKHLKTSHRIEDRISNLRVRSKGFVEYELPLGKFAKGAKASQLLLVCSNDVVVHAFLQDKWQKLSSSYKDIVRRKSHGVFVDLPKNWQYLPVLRIKITSAKSESVKIYAMGIVK